MKILGNLDGNYNELEHVRVDLVDELPSSGYTGQMVFVSPLGSLYIYTGTAWRQVVLTDLGSPISGATNLVVSNDFEVDNSTTLEFLTVNNTATFKSNVNFNLNYITINNGEPAHGVAQYGSTAGFWVDRGLENNVSILWFETDDSWKLTRDGTNFYTILDEDYANGVYLRLDGGNSPSSDISWNNHKITDLADATNNYDAVSYKFVNDRYLRLDGSNTPSSDISWNNYSITDLKEPVNNQDVATKHYVDVSIDSAPFIKLDGSNSPTNDINFNGNRIKNLKDPMELQDAATRNYVDNQITNHDQEHDDTFLRLDGINKPTSDIDFDNNRIINLSDPTNAQDAATKNYVDTLYYSGGGDRGVYVPGVDDSGTTLNSMRYINIAVLSDATYFNTLYTSGRIHSASTSNGIRDRGVIFGGTDATGNVLDSIEYVSISTGSAANFFGNLGYKSTNSGGAFSNS